MEINTELPPEERVRKAFRRVDSPEVGMNIIELGLVYRIKVVPQRVHAQMTMTTPACPMGDLITDGAHRAVGAALPDGVEMDMELVWESP